MKRSLLILALALVAACKSTSPAVAEDPDPELRASLLDAVKSLEGTWAMPGADGEPQITEFQVTSAGSAVREIMFPGSPHEMTNMMHLDGNALVLTHYCAAGNQPRMVAHGMDGDRIVFRADSVSNLASPDEVYMGEMTLELIDGEHFEQHWRAISGDEVDHEMDFAFERLQ